MNISARDCAGTAVVNLRAALAIDPTQPYTVGGYPQTYDSALAARQQYLTQARADFDAAGEYAAAGDVSEVLAGRMPLGLLEGLILAMHIKYNLQ